MKKIILLLAALWLMTISANKTSAITDAEMQGDPTSNEAHFVWDLMSAMDTPDDTAACLTAAQNFLTDEGLSSEQITQISTSACASLANMRTEMQSGMPDGNGETESIETNLFDATDWHSVQNLYFQHSTNGVADGRIAFTIPIDFMSYAFMNFMRSFGENMETGSGIIGLNADVVNGMRGYGAVLTMYNVDIFENPVILVNGAEDTDGVVSNLVYDRAARTVTFNAAHFTTFEVTEGSTGEIPKITHATAKKYENKKGAEIIRVTIHGQHFKSKAKVKLGSKRAYRVVKISSKKLIAYFKMAEVRKLDKDARLKLKIINPGSNDKTYKKRLNLNNIKPLQK